MSTLLVDEYQVKLSNLDKTFWPKHNYKKSDLINYYIEIYPLIKNYLKDRPLSLQIFPDGVKGKSFFQKNAATHAPEWLSTTAIYSRHRQEAINWVMVNKLPDLIWIANSASIELHSWFSTYKKQDYPDFAVFDLDPPENPEFKRVIELAIKIKEILDELNIRSFLKTSGKAGLHIYIPLKNRYSYEDVKQFLRAVAEAIITQHPNLSTIEWRKKERQGKIYIDYRQNGRSKTLATPYSLRPTDDATISTPLEWKELNQNLNPKDFNLSTIIERIENKGDLWSNILLEKQELPHFLFK
ncbi:non-homologous end-joining DNA ligase [Natronospora cellulosivora (SeqCode)]